MVFVVCLGGQQLPGFGEFVLQGGGKEIDDFIPRRFFFQLQRKTAARNDHIQG